MPLTERQPQNSEAVLIVRDLSAAYQIGNQELEAVRDISLVIQQNQTYGLVGESGSGKTTLAMAVMGYLGNNGAVTKGSIDLKGQQLLELSEDEKRKLWGTEIGLVPQNPLSSLNPSLKIGKQVGEILEHHRGYNTATAYQKTIALLEKVHIPDPARVADSYPHQLSGGMRQRVLIAMAISMQPDLLILDEPTSSLDVSTEASILDLIRELKRAGNSSALYVTHNLGVVAQICERVAVLYAGELIEDAELGALFEKPLHPYTLGLLGSVPKLGVSRHGKAMVSIEGQLPALGARPSGCVFAPRCPLKIEKCKERPALSGLDGERRVRCHRWEEIASGSVDRKSLFEVQGLKEDYKAYVGEPSETLRVKDMQVYFPIARPLVNVIKGMEAEQVKAVDGISLSIQRGQTVGLVGESGSGKTTIARATAGLEALTGGEMQLMDSPLHPKLSKRDAGTLRQIQMVFQNPEGALNPHISIGTSLKRPLVRLMSARGEEADDKVRRLLEAVRLPAEYAARMPQQLSGGEKQRAAIARAFASNPDLLLADEPVSSLDVSVRASILNTLNELQLSNQNAILFISHDLAVVSHTADILAVIYLGKIMEVTRAENLLEAPYHPYTEALISCIPVPDPNAYKARILLEGEIPSPVNPPSGCRFHTRCHRFIGDICEREEPAVQIDKNGKQIFCHIALDELERAQKKRALNF